MMNSSTLVMGINIFLVAWPVLYLFLWHHLGYRFPKRSVDMNTLFYVSRSQLWSSLYRKVVLYMGVPMTIINAAAYASMYQIFHGTKTPAEKILLLYLIVFGACFNLLYMSLILCKHGFTKEEKSKGFQLVRGIHTLMSVFQFLFLDGYIISTAKLKKSFSLTSVMNHFGFIGYVVELLILIICLILTQLFIKMAKRFFLSRDFLR